MRLTGYIVLGFVALFIIVGIFSISSDTTGSKAEGFFSKYLAKLQLGPLAGTVSINLIQPPADVQVNQFSSFNVEVDVICGGTDCGDIDVTLEYPGWPYWPANGDFETGDATDWSSDLPRLAGFITQPGQEGPNGYSAFVSLFGQGGSGTEFYQTFDPVFADGIRIWHIGDLGFFGIFKLEVHNGVGWVEVESLSEGVDFIDWTELNFNLGYDVSGIKISGVGNGICDGDCGETLASDLICLTDVLGNCLVRPPNLVSDNSNDVPFYTLESNPQRITLGADQNQVVTFTVFASGDVDTTAEMFSSADLTDGSDSAETPHWNVLITEFVPQACPILLDSPGLFTLENDLVTTGTCITITADDVIVDGAGFSITGDDGDDDYGVVVQGAARAEIRDITLSDFGSGIRLESASTDSDIHDVTFTSNSQRGVDLDTSSGNSISDSTFSNNFNAVYLSGSSDNVLTNLVIQNVVQDSIVLDLASSRNVFDTVRVIAGFGLFKDIKFLDALSSETVLLDTHLGRYEFAVGGNTVTFEDTGEGVIEFLQPIEGTGNTLSADVNIANNFVEVNSLNKPGLDKQADITLWSVPVFGNPVILRDGFLCDISVCTAYTPLDADPVRFGVTGWTNYAIGNGVSFDLTLSPELENAISWDVQGSGSNQHALGNNGAFGDTDYWIDISAQGTNVDLYVIANGDLQTTGGDVIPLSSESYRHSLTDSIVPGSGETSLDTNLILVDSNLPDGQRVFLKFFLDVEQGASAGFYTNGVDFILVATP